MRRAPSPPYPLADTLKRADARGRIAATVDRDGPVAGADPARISAFADILAAHAPPRPPARTT